MPRSGTGTYTLPAPPSPFQDGQTISAPDMMTVMNDIATALTASTAADGQTPITGNWNFGGKNISNVGTLAATAVAATNASTSGGMTVGNALVVTTGGATITGNSTVVGTLGATAAAFGAASTSGGMTVGNVLVVTTGGATITGNSTVTGTVTVTVAGTSGNQVVNYSQFPATLGATGTTTLPNGLVMKWGIGSTALGTGSVSFAAAFPTACRNVQITIANGSVPAGLNPLIAGTVTAAGFDVWGDPTQSMAFFWQAIGD